MQNLKYLLTIVSATLVAFHVFGSRKIDNTAFHAFSLLFQKGRGARNHIFKGLLLFVPGCGITTTSQDIRQMKVTHSNIGSKKHVSRAISAWYFHLRWKMWWGFGFRNFEMFIHFRTPELSNVTLWAKEAPETPWSFAPGPVWNSTRPWRRATWYSGHPSPEHARQICGRVQHNTTKVSLTLAAPSAVETQVRIIWEGSCSRSIVPSSCTNYSWCRV